jgi:TIR domain.
MADFEEQLNELLERAKNIQSPINVTFGGINKEEYNRPSEEWMNDVQIFYEKYLKKHALGQRIDTLLFHRKYSELVPCLISISKDMDFINEMNGVQMVNVPKYKAKSLPEYDVFISHANRDKEDMVEALYQSIKRLGISIFYDKESLEWGDEWKKQIIEGTDRAEFAIIVISKNFFDREWTERELKEFLNRQNRNGQKIILPILHNITVEQLKEKYPSIADIQTIDSSKYNCDQIAILFARQLIKRLKSIK